MVLLFSVSKSSDAISYLGEERNAGIGWLSAMKSYKGTCVHNFRRLS